MQTHEKVEVIRLATGPQKHINEYKRFAILVLGSFGCIVCSFGYAWNLISGSMQKRYDLSQRDMSSIVTTGLVIQYFVLPYGFLFDYLGPIPVCIIGTVLFPLGTLLLALCFMGTITADVVWLCVFNGIMCSGCMVFDLACCVTVLSHFPTNRGPVVALLKTFTGLGSAMVACLYAGYFNSEPKQYFFFMFALVIAIGGLCIAFMRLPPYHLTGYEMSHLPEDEKERRFATKAQYLRQEAPLRRCAWGFFILIVLIIFLPTQSALVSYLKLGHTPQIVFAIVTTVLSAVYLLVAAPLPFLNSSYIPFFNPVHTEQRELLDEAYDVEYTSAPLRVAAYSAGNAPDAEDGRAAEVPVTGAGKAMPYDAAAVNEVLEEDVSGTPLQAPVETEVDYLAPQYQGTFFHNLLTMDLWSLWWTLFIVGGAELTIIYNASFILAALQSAAVDSSLRTMLTVLNGVGSAVGRLLMSYFEVWSQKRKPEDRIPLTVALFFPTGSIIISIVLFLVLPARALPLPYVIAALGNGFLAGAILLVTRTIYAKDPAKHYNFCFTSVLACAVVFNRFLYGEWYTVQAEKQARADKMCYGKNCVLMPLLVMLGLSCSAFATDVVLHFRYRSYCIKTLEERARLQAEMRELQPQQGVTNTSPEEEERK